MLLLLALDWYRFQLAAPRKSLAATNTVEEGAVRRLGPFQRINLPRTLPGLSRIDAIPPGEAPEACLITAELIKAAAAARPATGLIEQRQSV